MAQVNQPPVDQQAFSIQAFCLRNDISLHLYHKLRATGRGPRTMALGRAIRISIEAEREWRMEREEPADSEARLILREAAARVEQAKLAAKHAVASRHHVSQRNKAGA